MNTNEWLARLVACDTTSRHSNLQLIEMIKEWLLRHQITPRLTEDAQAKKANLFATIPAHDGNIEGGIIFSGHTDVVPVDGQVWDSNPFETMMHDDKIYGRGTCDMKGFLAVVLALLPEFQQLKLRHPIHFAFSYDEEIGCKGAPLLIADMQKIGLTPKACIVGEPTNMRPVVAHKGIQVFRCKVQGHATHSSLTPQACNAIEYAARLICHIRELAEKMRHEGPFDQHYDVPFTTMSTNMIQGGNAHNTVPASCEFFFEYRNLPEVKPRVILDDIFSFINNDLLLRMKRENVNALIELDSIAAVPSFEADQKAAFSEMIRKLTDEKEIRKVAYATEAGLFEQAHIPTIVCGPGSIEQAHRANEYVEISQLKQCETFLHEVVKVYCE